MMGAHLSDETLSTLADQRLPPRELARARAHLRPCATCSTRLEDFARVRELLRALPDLAPPRDLTVGPRPLEAAPGRRSAPRTWYAAARVLGSLSAALFILLLGSDLYSRSIQPARPGPASAPLAAVSRMETAPAATSGDAARAAPGQSFAAGATDSGTAYLEKASPDPPRPLSAPAPTPAAAPPASSVVLEPFSPVRIAAVLAGGVSVLSLATALALRRRIRSRSS